MACNLTAAISCSFCPVTKCDFKALEGHIRREHLQWEPYQCQECGQKRTTNVEMREHALGTHGARNATFLFRDDDDKCTILRNALNDALNQHRRKEIEAQGNSASTLDSRSGSSVMLFAADMTSSDLDMKPTLASCALPTCAVMRAVPMCARLARPATNPRCTSTTNTDQFVDDHPSPSIVDQRTPHTEEIGPASTPAKEKAVSERKRKQGTSERRLRIVVRVDDPKVGDTQKFNASGALYCAKCKKTLPCYSKVRHVQMHLLEEHKLFRYQCKTCGAGFQVIRPLALHVGREHGCKEFEDSMCEDHGSTEKYQQLAARVTEECFA